jgi:glutamine amidotransferase
LIKVAVVNFGAGNLLSICRALRHLGAFVELADTPEAVAAADRLVLPGVGAFGACMTNLRQGGLDLAVKDFAATGRPFLGICVGLQMLFDESEEFGVHAGLGLIPGRVTRIPAEGIGGVPHKIPHIGWNTLRQPAGAVWERTPLAFTSEGTSVYFVHSFSGHPADERHALAFSDYNGVPILAAARRDNMTGVQFHPEKSGQAGLNILSAYLEAP